MNSIDILIKAVGIDPGSLKEFSLIEKLGFVPLEIDLFPQVVGITPGPPQA